MKPIHVTILISALTLASCAHQQPTIPQESFSTLIKPDDTKQFSYSMTIELPKRKDFGGETKSGLYEGPPRKGKDKTYGGKGPLLQEDLSRMFDEALSSKLQNTKFCRNGFKKLDEKSGLGNISVRGECNETANSKDRETFPNPPSKKVKVDVLE